MAKRRIWLKLDRSEAYCSLRFQEIKLQRARVQDLFMKIPPLRSLEKLFRLRFFVEFLRLQNFLRALEQFQKFRLAKVRLAKPHFMHVARGFTTLVCSEIFRSPFKRRLWANSKEKGQMSLVRLGRVMRRVLCIRTEQMLRNAGRCLQLVNKANFSLGVSGQS